jgi:hypothetical protein
MRTTAGTFPPEHGRIRVVAQIRSTILPTGPAMLPDRETVDDGGENEGDLGGGG